MPDPIIPYQPFGTIPSWPPSPAKLDRDLDAQHHHIINVDWSTSQINLTTDVTGQLPYANIQNVTAQRLLGRDTGVGIVQEIIIGANLTLTGGTLSAATSGGAGLGDFSTNTATSVVNEIVLFSDTTGKQGKRSTGSGRPKLTSGVMSLAAVDLTSEVTGVLPAANVAVLPTANIADLAVTNAKLAGGITASNLVGTDIATVGTITTGTWAGSTISKAYGGTNATNAQDARSTLGLNIEATTNVGDTDYTITEKDRVVCTSVPLTAARSWTLPLASSVNLGTQLRLVDAIGTVTAANNITVAVQGGNTINGESLPFIMNKAFDALTFIAVNATSWVVSAGNRGIIRKTFFINQTYTTPVGVKSLFVECVGGGGAGGGAAVSAANLSVGSGGGGGGYSALYIASPATSYLITIGAGGTGSAGNAGGNGGDTTFGAVISAGGASGGSVIAAGTGVALLGGGDSGIGSLGDRNIYGNAGGTAIRLSATVGISGQGGAGAVYSSANLPVNTTASGNIGHSYGGGGSGALTTGAAQAGGNGNSGACFVTEYY